MLCVHCPHARGDRVSPAGNLAQVNVRMENRNWKVPFYTIWIGQAVSLAGSRLVRFALIWWLTETTGSATILATATSVGFLPTIFLGPFAGALVDRLPRKWVLIVSDGSIALLTALLSLLFWLDIAQPWHVLGIIFLRSVGDAFQSPAMTSTTPLMVPRDQLSRVAGMNSTLFGVLNFAIPPLGAVLLGVMGVRGVLPLDVLTALLALIPLAIIAIPDPEVKAKAVLTDMREGLRYIWDWRGMRWILGTSMAAGIFLAPLFSFTPLLVTQHFGGGALELGWLSSASGIGMLVGGFVLSAWGGFRRHMNTAIVGALISGAGRILVGLAPGTALWLAIIGQFISGVGFSGYMTGSRATQQSTVAPEMQGRFFAVRFSAFTALTPISLAIAGPIADAFGVRLFWFLMPIVSLISAAIWRFVPEIYHIEDRAHEKRSAASGGQE